MISSATYASEPTLFLTMAIAATTLTPAGFSRLTVAITPAADAAPHLTRDMPAMMPPALMSAPPVSYVIPFPTMYRVFSTFPSGSYVNQITLPSCLST